jgi:hypothetical protein
MLMRVIKRLETQSNDKADFIAEKRSIFGQFVAFAVAFVFKAIFNIYLIVLDNVPESSVDNQMIWTTIWLLWSGLPITYSFVQNWNSFRSSQ